MGFFVNKPDFTVYAFFFALLCIGAVLFQHERIPWHTFSGKPKINQGTAHHNETRLEDIVTRQLYTYEPDRNYSYDDLGFAPATKLAQDFIKRHQHPINCTGKKFVIARQSTMRYNGFGSIIHVLSLYLAKAIEQDRILVWESGFGAHFVDHGCDFGCLFEPISSCTYGYAQTVNFTEALLLHNVFDFVPEIVKGIVREVLPEHNLTDAFYKYWWRAQGAGYIARLSKSTLDAVTSLRMDKNLHSGYKRHDGTIEKIPLPYPLPRGTVNAHVRHGDKYIEMTLVPFKDYAQVAEKFVNTNPLSFRHSLFISTEDPTAIDEAMNMTLSSNSTSPDMSWVIYVSHIKRLNSGPLQQLLTLGGKKSGRQAVTFTWILQLLMALECDAYIGTRGSNWNRLIDELRCVWINKCENPYFEVGLEKDWKGYQFK